MKSLIDVMDLNRIENSLLLRREKLMEATSWSFNMLMLGLVLLGFGYFLYVQYNSNQEQVPEVNIPFKPTTWYSATRNVRSEEYGQPIETEVGYGVS